MSTGARRALEGGGPEWSVKVRGGIPVIRCALIEGIPGVAHGFSTRQGRAREPFDLGPAGPPDAVTAQRRREFAEACGLAPAAPLILRQVHGADVVFLDEASPLGPGDEPAADGVVARRGAVAERFPAVRVADCVPLLLADRDGDAVAAVHAGWRGTAASIAHRAVAAFEARGIRPNRLVAALGPAIGGCCYEVGAEVLEQVGATLTGAAGAQVGPRCLDLRRANALQLLAAGLEPAAVSVAPWCTRCEPDRFFSFRREGAGAGRAMAAIGWAGEARGGGSDKRPSA